MIVFPVVAASLSGGAFVLPAALLFRLAVLLLPCSGFVPMLCPRAASVLPAVLMLPNHIVELGHAHVMAVLHGERGIILEQNPVYLVFPQGHSVGVGLPHQAHVRPDADSPMLPAAMGTGNVREQLRLFGRAL